MKLITQMLLMTELIEYIFTGLFILNAVVRDDTLRIPLVNKLKERFTSVSSFKNEEELNEIFICRNCSTVNFREQLLEAVNQLNCYFKKTNNTDQIVDANEDILQKYKDI